MRKDDFLNYLHLSSHWVTCITFSPRVSSLEVKFASYQSPSEVIWHSPLTQPLELFYGSKAALPRGKKKKKNVCSLTTRCTCASLNFPFYISLFRRCWQRNARRQLRLHTSGTERSVHQVWHFSKDNTYVLELFYCSDPVKSDTWCAYLHFFFFFFNTKTTYVLMQSAFFHM